MGYKKVNAGLQVKRFGAMLEDRKKFVPRPKNAENIISCPGCGEPYLDTKRGPQRCAVCGTGVPQS